MTDYKLHVKKILRDSTFKLIKIDGISYSKNKIRTKKYLA
jgi:hypothetical protein